MSEANGNGRDATIAAPDDASQGVAEIFVIEEPSGQLAVEPGSYSNCYASFGGPG